MNPFAQPDTVPSLNTVDEDLRAGLPASKARLADAWTRNEVFQLRSEQFIERRMGEDDEHFRHRPKRTSAICRGAIEKLSEPVYDPGPQRTLENDPGLNEWLEDVYRDASVNAILGEAEAASTLNHAAAIQIEATGDPNRPIKLWLWRGHEFEVFCRSTDPTDPWCVVTRDIVPDGLGKVRTRYRAWTAFECRTYLTDPYTGQGSGAVRADHQVDEQHPYPGVLPFIIVRAKPAATLSTFWEGGIGGPLADLNMEIDRCLSDLAEHVQTFLNPKAFARNVAIGSRFFDRVGEFIQLKSSAGQRSGDVKSEPDVFYLQGQLAVQDAWQDVQNQADATLEELGLPLTLIRSSSATDLSGVAIVAKSLPIIKRTRRRQTQVAEQETNLASRVLAVASVWYGGNGWNQATAATQAATDPQLTLAWPEPQIPLPAPERDQADDWELANGLTDPIEVLARRRGLTIGQATELAETLAERRKLWIEINRDPAKAEANEAEPDAEPEDDPEDPSESEKGGDLVGQEEGNPKGGM